MAHINIGSRASRLAVVQAEIVRDMLSRSLPGFSFDIKTYKTSGDKILDRPLELVGGKGLFTKEFYGNCYRALREDGILVYQHGSPFYDEDEESCRAMHHKASKSFPVSRVYQAHIPTCASGYWLFGFISKKYHPLNDLDEKRWKERNIKTWYYTTNLHRGAFMLPKYVEDMLEEEEA